MDSSKAHLPDLRHRLLLHHSFGIELATKMCGRIELVDGKYIHTGKIVNSDGKVVYVRDVAEQHVYDDTLGIPSVEKAFMRISVEHAQPVIGAWTAMIRKFLKREQNSQETAHGE